MTSEQLQETKESDYNAHNDASRYLTFIIAGEEYGVDILRVQEIKGWDTITEIPNTPEYIRGVLNLRGTIVPVIDIRKRFELDSIEYGNTTVIIVLKLVAVKGERIMGFVVDAVSDVYNVTQEQLHAPPDFGAIVSTDFIRGVATVNEKMVILLDVDRLVDVEVVEAETEVAH